MSIERQKLRLKIETSRKDLFSDDITKEAPRIWRGTAVQFEVGIFYLDVLQPLSNVTSLTLEVKPFATRTVDPVMQSIVGSGDFTNGFTKAQWDAGIAQHCTFVFDDDETAPVFTGVDGKFWLVVSGVLDDGNKVTLGATCLTISEDGTGADVSPPIGDPTYLTAAQIAAGYVPIWGDGSNFRFKVGTGAQIYVPDTVKWHTITGTGNPPTLGLAEVGED